MEERNRDKWANQAEFLLSCIGYAVGLGNIWRFPYLCMRNGGGAFLIPYITFTFLCGMPLFYMEMALGQFSNLSPLCVWKICPLLKGIGWAMAILSWIWCLYTNVIITWTLYFMGKSFTKALPWASCDNPWNTDSCYTRTVCTDNCTDISYEPTENITTSTISNNVTSLVEIIRKKRMTSAEEFYQFNVLGLSSGVWDFDGFKWDLVICYIVGWVIVYLCICKGIKTSGKVVYVTATLPYLIFIVLLIRGVTLPGSLEGIIFYIKPKWEQLANFSVWGDACIQTFYSLGASWGAVITMSSYNEFTNNAKRDSIIVPVMNAGTSIFGGFVVFSIIGFLAKEANLPVEEVITSGPGLAFIAYPEALAHLPVAPVWAVLFFLMLITIGLDSQFGTFETVVVGIVDTFPKQLERFKPLVCLVVCLVTLVIGLPLVTHSGLYIFQLLDWYAATFSCLIVAVAECIAICWIYGVKRFSYDISMMTGSEPNIIWRVIWSFIIPFLLVFIMGFNAWHMTNPKIGEYTYPDSALVLGWLIAFLPVTPIPILAIHELLSRKGSLIERIKVSLQPSADWGPQDPKNRAKYRYTDPEELKEATLLQLKNFEAI